MSTTATDAGTIVTALTGYTRIQDGKPIEQAPTSKVHKSYTLELGEPDIQLATSETDISSRLFILRVSYRVDKDNTYDSNNDLFEAVYDTIKALAGYMNKESVSYGWADDETGKTCIGEFEFYYGVRTC